MAEKHKIFIESVDFKAWLGEQQQTPMMEAVTQIYDALFENSVSDQIQAMLDEEIQAIEKSNVEIDKKNDVQDTDEEKANLKRLADFKQDLIKFKAYVDKVKSNELLDKYIEARKRYNALYQKLMQRNLEIKRQQYKELDDRDEKTHKEKMQSDAKRYKEEEENTAKKYKAEEDRMRMFSKMTPEQIREYRQTHG